MGKIKATVIHEEDVQTIIAQAVNYRAARVAADGGNAMSNGGIMAILAMMEKEAADKGMTLEQLAESEAEEHERHVQGNMGDKELVEASEARLLASRLNVAVGDTHSPAVIFEMPPQDYMRKGHHYKLVFQGVCSNCAHCALKLTDSVSIERGIGPVCSKRGYAEDPTNTDEMQAMIDLSEFPALVDFLIKNYKPLGVRGLMNGLVKICSLNRGSPVHQACCDAIESLGYTHLASTLRESTRVVEIEDFDDTTYRVWVKRSEWHPGWSYDLQRLSGAYLSRQHKGWLVPKAHKNMLWALILKHYPGYSARVPFPGDKRGRTVKIVAKMMQPPPSQPSLPVAQ